MRIGEAIRKLRKKLGLTQVEFASRIGVTTRAVQFYEAHDKQPDAGALMALLCAAAQAGAPASEFASALERSLRLDKRQICLIVVSQADVAGDDGKRQQPADLEEAEQDVLLRYMGAPLYDQEDDNSDGKKVAPHRVGLLTARALGQAFLEWSGRA